LTDLGWKAIFGLSMTGHAQHVSAGDNKLCHSSFMEQRDLSAGTWLNPPVTTELTGDGFAVTAKEHSDFWRTTSYGFIHDTGHVLLNDFPQGSAIEASWILDYDHQFDQAGLMAFADSERWIKAGVEYADGAPQLGAVVTDVVSDWSVAPVNSWMNKEVHLRLSRSGDALTIRARCEGPWQLVRLAPLDPQREWKVGIHLASPTRSGLTVRFTHLATGPADIDLH
jgi:regulation of enolase protein 1 (concanavalin A-like superfamily)